MCEKGIIISSYTNTTGGTLCLPEHVHTCLYK